MIGAGGTAGHVVPALAVADALRSAGAEVVFVCGERAELELVPAAGYELRRVRVLPLPRNDYRALGRAAVIDAGAVGQALRVLGELRQQIARHRVAGLTRGERRAGCI